MFPYKELRHVEQGAFTAVNVATHRGLRNNTSLRTRLRRRSVDAYYGPNRPVLTPWCMHCSQMFPCHFVREFRPIGVVGWEG